MEDHHFQWVKPLLQWSFSIAHCESLPEASGNRPEDGSSTDLAELPKHPPMTGPAQRYLRRAEPEAVVQKEAFKHLMHILNYAHPDAK